MTDESSGDDDGGSDEAREDDGRRGSGPPTEEDVEAAREELAAVGSEGDRESSADGEPSVDGDSNLDGDTDPDADSGSDSGADTEPESDEEDESVASADEHGPDVEETDVADGRETDDVDDVVDGHETDDAADDADADGAAEVDEPAPAGSASDERGADDGGVDGGASADADADEGDTDGAVHAEDLVETPEERAATESSGVDAAATATDAGEVDSAGEADVDTVETAADETDGEPTGADDTAAGDTAAAETDATAAADTDATAADADTTETDDEAAADAAAADENGHQPGVPEDVRKYDRFKKVDGAQYDRVNEFLRDRTYITAREWAIARLCSDFRTETGVEMTKIGENLPELVPFMTDTYTAQAVNQARASFEEKVRTAGATFLYGAMCDFFTAEELDDVMYESTEVAKFLLEVEGVELSVEEELEAEDRISAVMREVRESSAELRHEECPECGAHLTADD